MSSDALCRLLNGGPLTGAITLEDPDSKGRVRNVYEDAGYDEATRRHLAVLRLYPEHAKAKAAGDEDAGVFALTHDEARRDVERMLRQGFIAT